MTANDRTFIHEREAIVTCMLVINVLASALPCSADNATQVTFDAAQDNYPAWSPDGTLIAFQSMRSGNLDIWLVPATGGSATQLTFNAGLDTYPAWSPDGTEIAFSSKAPGDNLSYIYTVPAAGGTPTRVTPDGATSTSGPGELGPAWSPDGGQIAFNKNSNNVTGMDIWLAPTDGGLESRLTFEIGLEVDPAWSPDGSTLAFRKSLGGTEGIYAIDVDGGGSAAPLTLEGVGGNRPCWSPDGMVIAFDADPVLPSQYDIWTIPSSGGTETRITDDPAVDFSPTWSPDGSLIAFASTRSGNEDIWIIPVAGPVSVTESSWGSVKAGYR